MANQALLTTRLEKAAQDNGFDLPKQGQGDWLAFASSHCPLKIWLSSRTDGKILFAISDLILVQELSATEETGVPDLPSLAKAVFAAADFPSLYSLMKRSFQLSRSLPNEPLKEYLKQTQNLPQSTEVERLVIQRVGQNIFRERLMDYWDGKCAVTGLAISDLLRASHIKPWRDCASDVERLDVFNGLLLAPHLDAAFDKGLISFNQEGSIIVAKNLGSQNLALLGISSTAKCANLTEAHQKYLEWHRHHEFKGEN